MIIEILILVAVLAFVSAFAFSPRFRQMLRIRGGNAVDSMTTTIEKEKDVYRQLMNQLPVQREAVSSVMARSSIAEKDLETAKQTVESAFSEYNEAKGLGASDQALDALAVKWEDAKEAVEAAEELLNEMHAAEEEATDELEKTINSLKKFEKQIEKDEAKSELATALKISAAAREQSGGLRSKISEAGKHSRTVDLELEKARAANNLSKGSKVDRELEDLSEKAKAKKARSSLEGSTKQ